LVPHGQEHLLQASSMSADNLTDLAQMWKPLTSVDAVVSNAITTALYGKALVTGSLRIAGASDELVKTVRYRAIVSAKASLEADERGLAAGTQAYTDYVSGRLEAAFDGTGRGIDKDAVAEAQASTFQQELVSGDDTWRGGWANGYAQLVRQ